MWLVRYQLLNYSREVFTQQSLQVKGVGAFPARKGADEYLHVQALNLERTSEKYGPTNLLAET